MAGKLATEAGNTPVSNRLIQPSVEGSALNVGLEGGRPAMSEDTARTGPSAGFFIPARGYLHLVFPNVCPSSISYFMNPSNRKDFQPFARFCIVASGPE